MLDDLIEEYGVFGRLVGRGTFLSDRMADDVVALVALDLMTQAVKAGMSQAGLVVLRHVSLAWMQQRRAGRDEPRFVSVRPDDLAMAIDTDVDSIMAALTEISAHLSMNQLWERDGRVTLNLSAWIPLDDSRLVTELDRLWLLDHVAAVQSHCHEAKHFLDQQLNAPTTPDAERPEAVARMAELRARRAAWEARQKLTLDGTIEEAMADLWKFHDEVAELEHLYDCVVGLLAEADGYLERFGLIWKEQGRAKLQALSLPSRVFRSRSNAGLEVGL
ncbi:hypothetical protein BZG35_09520 [Brevundimonas sp. LM2]|uniref:hypothetical protein n=1 Tax=Brevundimonas sp. LM2 TaxID=1938605 RepID=UPI000983D6F4|nr:hypothetical protein [Brevundimonas sp. LM2]AQR61862.1 hypothetical protein BZG35_09520 [Brevundimonas sp. LM2]